MEKNKKIKIVIIVLAVLLGISLLALGGTVLYNRLTDGAPATVTVPDNLITPDADASDLGNGAEVSDGGAAAGSSDGNAAAGAQGTAAAGKQAAAIELYNRQPEDNTPFQVGNMFPGDRETKYYLVRVSYHDKVAVHYRASVRPGYEKLAEVMQVRVKLLTTGETLYDGLMRDMPESVTHSLASAKTTTDELYYEITAYLDTSVDNAYQNKDLIADFRWWVEETGNLDDAPKTGDTTRVVLWAVLAGCSAAVLILLLVTRKRKEDDTHD